MKMQMMIFFKRKTGQGMRAFNAGLKALAPRHEHDSDRTNLGMTKIPSIEPPFPNRTKSTKLKAQSWQEALLMLELLLG